MIRPQNREQMEEHQLQQSNNVLQQQQLDTRTHVVGELYDTERSYVESLQTLIEVSYRATCGSTCAKRLSVVKPNQRLLTYIARARESFNQPKFIPPTRLHNFALQLFADIGIELSLAKRMNGVRSIEQLRPERKFAP